VAWGTVDGVFCHNCGHRNPEGVNFCSSCGAALLADGDDATITLHPADEGETTEDYPDVTSVEIPHGAGVLVVTRGPNIGARYLLGADVVKAGAWQPALEALKRAGKIRYYGISCDTVDAARAALQFPEVSSLQFLVNLLERRAVESFLPEMRAHGVAGIARECLAKRLAGFDPAARQMPAADVAMPDQKHAVFIVKHDGAYAERHAARKSPVEMKEPPQRRLKTSSQALHHRCHGKPYTRDYVDPCIPPAGLPIHSSTLQGGDETIMRRPVPIDQESGYR